MTGRSLRKHENQVDAIIFDHAGNAKRLGLAEDIDYDSLDSSQKPLKKKKQRKKLKICKQCNELKEKPGPICEHCGFESKAPRSDIVEEDGELFEIGESLKKISKPAVEKATKEEKQKWLSGLLYYAAEKGYKKGWASHKYKQKFGVWPQNLNWIASPPDSEILGYIKHLNIKKAIGRQKAQMRNDPAEQFKRMMKIL
jgi:DNA repair protein RadD